MRKRPLTAAFVARVKTPGTLRRRGARRARAVPPRPPDDVRARLQVLGSADSSGREAHQSRTGLVPGRDAQGSEREGAGEQAVDPLGPRPESREGSHLRGGRREGDGDPLADLEGPLPHRRAVAADAAGLRPSAHRPEARERGRDGRRARHPQAHLVKQARSGEGRTSADRRGDEVGRREGLPVGQPGGGRHCRRATAQRQCHQTSPGAPARRGVGGSGRGPQLGVPCRCPAGARVHGPDRDTLERGPGRGVGRGRARCLDHSRQPHEGEARAPGSPVEAGPGDPCGSPEAPRRRRDRVPGREGRKASTPRCSAGCSGISASRERLTG